MLSCVTFTTFYQYVANRLLSEGIQYLFVRTGGLLLHSPSPTEYNPTLIQMKILLNPINV